MINEFKDSEVRKSGVIYRSTFNQIKKLYDKNPLLAGELAISAIELVLTGDISSDDDNIDMYLEVNREVAQKNFDAYDAKVENDRRNKIIKYQYDEIARLYQQKYTQKAIAQQLKLSQQTVSNRLAAIRKDFPELLQDGTSKKEFVPSLQEKNACTNLQVNSACTNEEKFVQTCTNVQEENVCTNNVELVQEENTCTKQYNCFNFQDRW